MALPSTGYAPAAVPGTRKFRDGASTTLASSANIMFDSRVRRGKTLGGSSVEPAAGGAGLPGASQTGSRTRKRIAPNPFKASAKPLLHEDLDLTPFLVEDVDKKVVANVTTQTDAFLPPPAPGRYIPSKTGVDVGTQIVQGELFDFDEEVEPLLAVIVGKTLEQGLLEVMEERELDTLQRARHGLVLGQEAEEEAVRALEAAAVQRQQEAATALTQQRQRARREAVAVAKVAAFAAARALTSAAVSAAQAHLVVQGRFHDAEAEAAAAWVDDVLTPATEAKLATRAAVGEVVLGLVGQALVAQKAALAGARAAAAAEAAAAEAAAHLRELKRQYLIKITVHPPADLVGNPRLQARLAARAIGADAPDEEDSEADEEDAVLSAEPVPMVIGPFPVARIDSVADVTARIHAAADAVLARAITAARVAAGLQEEAEEEDEGEEVEPLPEGSLLWMRFTRLALTLDGAPLPPSSSLHDYEPQALLSGLGVATRVAEGEGK